MSATVPDSASPLGESNVAARRKRLADLGLIVFDLISERYHGGRVRTYDAVENADLIKALRVCSHYTNHISCLPADNFFAIEIKGTDGHDYIIQFSLHGPGFLVEASRAGVTTLSLADVPPGQESPTFRTFNILDDYSERIKLGGITIERAFLVGMSMVIGFMDEQGEDEDERLRPLVQFITPSREELRKLRERTPAPVIELDDDDSY